VGTQVHQAIRKATINKNKVNLAINILNTQHHQTSRKIRAKLATRNLRQALHER